MELLGALISAGARIFGGMLGSQASQQAAQRATDNANFQAQGGNLDAYLYNVRKAADAHGFSPLAVLGQGQGMQSFQAQTGDNGIGDAGQDIGRAVAALADKRSRADELNEKLLEAKVANVNADTVRLQAAASALATRLGQPGTGPGVPFPTPDPRGPVEQKYIRVIDRDGRVEDILNPKIATSYQTPASWPQQIGTAARDLYWGLRDSLVPTGAVDRATRVPDIDPYNSFPWN